MMKSAQEIELKFAASAKALRLMQRRLPAKTQNTKPKTLVSVYFDTAKLKLHKRGLSLRVRRDGKRRLQTIKAGDRQGVVRGEWEHETTSDGPELKAARGSPAYELLAQKKVRRALKPVFETRVTRVAHPVEAGDSVVEISFDQGEIDTGRACWPISEVEFELKRGHPADLFKLAKDFARKSPVELALASKAERGYVLLNGEKDTPIKAASIAVAPDMEAGPAFQAIARSCLRQLVDNLPALRQRDPEGLHQARVALRRLRANISLFAELVHNSQTQAIKHELKWITNEFGPAREMDILAARASDGAETQSPMTDVERTGVPAIKNEVRQKRSRAFGRARSAIASPRFRIFLVDLVAWIETGAWLASNDPLLQAEAKRPIAGFAREELSRRRKKILKRGRKLRELDPPRRHKLRIEVKKIRYAAEFFGGVFPGRKANRRRQIFLGKLEPLQDCLGDLNDITVNRELTAHLAMEQQEGSHRKAKTAAAFVVGELAGREQARLASTLDAAEKAFNSFVGVKRFW